MQKPLTLGRQSEVDQGSAARLPIQAVSGAP